MIKDTFFSLPRFMNLCRKEMVENWKSNVLRIVLLYGVMTLVMIWNGYFEYNRFNVDSKTDPMEVFLLITFMWSLWGFGCLSASFTMGKMKSKTSRLSVLMTPATPFEKFFSSWLVFTIGYLVVFLITYKMADYTRVVVYSFAYPEMKSIVPVDLGHLVGKGDYYTLCRTDLGFLTLIAGYFFFQSCFVLGSAVWPKNSFLKTFAAGTIITIVYLLVAKILGHFLFLNNIASSLISNSPSEEAFLTLLFFVCVFMALLNWVLAYLRFKESEIINRM